MQMLGISHSTIYRMISRGELEAVKIGSSTRITDASISKLIRAQNPSWSPEADEVPPLVRQEGKARTPATAPKPDTEPGLEKRVAALEYEVAALRKLISKFKEAINEHPQTVPAASSRHRSGRH
jgi:excisionase family DNA binding protein